MSDGDREGPRLSRALTIVYGLLIITAFGAWFYGYGVLIEPIARDTGWSEAWLSAAYGGGLFAVGLGAVVLGRWLDRRGPRPVFAVGAAGGAVGTVLTATATHPVVFVLAAVLAHTFIGAAGYYTLVHAAIARLAPEHRTRAITVNTLWGAFSSPVYLPFMAWLTTYDWRTAVAVGSGLAVVTLAAAAVLSPAGVADEPAEQRSITGDLRLAFADPVIRRLLLVALLSGAAFSVLILYQVPAMVSAGLALGTASTLAGLRGILQLTGRLPLPWLVDRLGPRTFFRISIALLAVAALLLPLSGTLAVALVFAGVGGFAVGAFATMESVYTVELAPAAQVGMIMGAYSLVRGVGSALGPAGAGLLTDIVDSRAPALMGVAVLAVMGALVVPARARAERPTA